MKGENKPMHPRFLNTQEEKSAINQATREGGRARAGSACSVPAPHAEPSSLCVSTNRSPGWCYQPPIAPAAR